MNQTINHANECVTFPLVFVHNNMGTTYVGTNMCVVSEANGGNAPKRTTP